jgi:hypothetical protein
VPAPEAAHLLRRQVIDTLAAELDPAAGDSTRRIQEADNSVAGHGLAGAGFADHAQNLAGLEVEADIVDSNQRSLARRELDRQVFDVQKWPVGGDGSPPKFLPSGTPPLPAKLWRDPPEKANRIRHPRSYLAVAGNQVAISGKAKMMAIKMAWATAKGKTPA